MDEKNENFKLEQAISSEAEGLEILLEGIPEGDDLNNLREMLARARTYIENGDFNAARPALGELRAKVEKFLEFSKSD
jgi:hypothetical protein